MPDEIKVLYIKLCLSINNVLEILFQEGYCFVYSSPSNALCNAAVCPF